MKEEKMVQAISEADINAWKAQWGKIYKTDIEGEIFIWRKLKRKEYVSIMSDKAEEGLEDSKFYERQDTIAKLVILYPANIEELIEAEAGLAPTIADDCLDKSGFGHAITSEL